MGPLREFDEDEVVAQCRLTSTEAELQSADKRRDMQGSQSLRRLRNNPYYFLGGYRTTP